MASIEELRNRAQRFLTGEFRPDDLFRIFLFLRHRHYGAPVVRELGDVLSHADERTKGIASEHIRTLYTIVSFKVPQLEGWTLDLDAAPPELFAVMRATLKLLNRGILLRDTGLKPDQASTALTKLERKFKQQPNGLLKYECPILSEKDSKLIRSLTGYIISDVAFDADELFNETKTLMLRYKLIDPSQELLLSGRRPHLLLFAIAALHDVRYILPGGQSCRATAGWSDETNVARLNVSITFEMPWKESTVDLSFPIFKTELKAAEWVDGWQDSRNGHWNCPIEVTAEPKLRVLE